MYWKSYNVNDIVAGKEYTTVQVNGNIVDVAMVGCSVANTNAQARWIKESYDTLVADGWKLFSGNANDFVLSKGDNLAASTTTNDGGTLTAAVVFMNQSTALAASGPTWTAVSNSRFGTSYINAIAYGGNRFVAVGDEGKMATSTDGTAWTAVNPGTTFDYQIFGNTYKASILAIAYGNNRFVAVGNNGKMATSTNGTAWTAVNISGIFEYRISAIAYGNGRFVVGGEAGKMATSTNGTAWTEVDASRIFGSSSIDGLSGVLIRAITYGNNRFVAVGETKMATSTNGTAWTEVDVSRIFGTGAADDIYAIAYGNNIFVAGSVNGKMATSTNGTTWTAVDVSRIFSGTHSYATNAISTISAIAYGNNKFVAVGAGGKMATSTNGTAWTAVDVSRVFGNSYISATAYGGGKFVAVGSDGKMAYLPD